MEYCAYLRKSRKDIEAEEHGEGDTLLRHERTLIELSEKLNKPIKKFYREIVSGDSISGRPVMKELLKDIENGIWKGVYVVEVERLARGDTSDQGLVARTFKYSSTLIITPLKIYNPQDEFDEEYFEYGLFMSRREYKTTTRRLQDGRKRSVTEGKYTGSTAPYGYEKYKLKGEKGYSLRIIPEEAEIVKMIYKLYTYGEEQPDGSYKRLGSTSLCNKLNEMNVFKRNTKTGKWNEPGILYILKNPIYIAKLWWNHRPENKKIEDGEIVITRPVNNDYELYKGKHQAIIDEKTWYDTQYALENTQVVKVPNAFLTTYNPLAGVVYCGSCGYSMVRRPYNSGSEDTLMCTTHGCKTVSSNLKDVEAEIITNLQEWLDNYKINYKNNFVGFNIESQLEMKLITKNTLITEENKVVKQIDNLHDLLEQNVYDIETYRQRKNTLNKKLEELQNNIVDAEKEIKHLNSNKKNIVEFIPKVEKVLKTYYDIEDSIKRNEMLKSILIRVEYFKDTKGHRFYKAPFTISLFPRLPK